MAFLLLFFGLSFTHLSCTNNSKPQTRFPHNFKDSSADDIYNISDFLGNQAVLNSEEVFFAPKDSPSPYPALSSKGGYPQDMLNSENLSKLVKLKTVSRGQKVVVSSAQENIQIDPSISFINKYQILDYEIHNAKSSKTNKYIAGLIGKTEKFEGFPDTTYYILPVFEGNYLLLYKLGPKDKIPYDELPLARRVGDMLAVPFLGYPIKYCIPEVIPDINRRKTGQYLPQCEGIPLRFAQYVKLREEDKQVFKYDKKTDLFPKDFFSLKEADKKEADCDKKPELFLKEETNKDESNNWFFVRTVVKAPKDSLVGHHLKPSWFNSVANLVEFEPLDNTLNVREAYNNIDDQDKRGSLFIPIEWVDYQIQRDAENLNSSFSEELKTDTLNQERRYFKIEFDKLVENETEYGGEKSLKAVVIKDDYFSFDVEVAVTTGSYLIKYAFYKKPVNFCYVAKQWFEEDSAQYFPSFAKERRYYETEEQHSPEDQDQYLRLTRFDPKAGEIRWYFSKQTPKDKPWIRELGRLAVKLTNRAFEEAGKYKCKDSDDCDPDDYKIKVILDESEDKEVGDIRYNILNLMFTKGKPSSGLLGLGPNIANPITGEVLSATANVWISNMLNLYTNRLKYYIRFEIYKPSWFLEPFSPEITEDLKEELYKLVCDEDEACMDRPFQAMGVSPFYNERIKALCPEVNRFIKDNKYKTYDPENPDLKDKDIIDSCAKKLAFLPTLGLTLHEMFHGLGQRHVFSASVDTENFYRDYKEIEGKEGIFGTLVSDTMKDIFKEDLPYVKGVKTHPQPAKYSSVMDYADLSNPTLFVPGKLDIDTFRFIYFDQVLLEDGGFLDVPAGANSDSKNPQKSINQTAEEQNKKPNQYNVLCGGEKMDKDYKEETNPDQPLCTMWDYGANPLEIVINNILVFHNEELMNGRNRYDSDGATIMSSIKEDIEKLYNKWKEKRDEVLSSIDTTIEDYAFFNPDHVTDYKGIIEGEAKKNSDFKSYYNIRGPIFDYLRRLLFMPTKHCIYKGDWDTHVVSLDKIRDLAKADWTNYPEDTREKLINCQSPVVGKLTEGLGSFVTEVGFFNGGTLSYLLRPKRSEIDRHDETSAFQVWSNVKDLISELIPEPDFGQRYYEGFEDYMFKGTYLNPYITKGKIPKDSQDQEIPLRVSSYGRDPWKGGEKGLALIEEVIEDLENKHDVKSYFGWELKALKDINLHSDSHDPKHDPLFFEQIKTSLAEDQQNRSIENFIKEHPQSLYDSFRPLWVVIPWQQGNFPARIFDRVNEFKSCLEKERQEGISCKDSIEKRAYVEAIEKYYYGGN